MTSEQPLDAANLFSQSSTMGIPEELNQATSLPTSLVATGVLSAIGGGLGLLSNLGLLANSLLGSKIANAFVQPGAIGDAQRTMNEGMQEIAARYFIPNVLMGSISFVVSLLLMVGGIALLRRKAWSRPLLMRTIWVLLIVEAAQLVLYVFTQLDMIPVMETYMKDIMASQGNGGGAPNGFVGSLAKIASFFGIAIWAAWAIGKMVLCFVGAKYLNRPTTIQFFQSYQSPATSNPSR